MSDRKRVWISPDGKGGWDVKTQGAGRAAANYEDKTDAVTRGREIAQATGHGQLIVQGQDGKIQYEHTYGNDPRKYPS